MPQSVAATAVAVLELCDRVADYINPHLASDMAVCAELAMATVRCATYNVRVNLSDIVHPDYRDTVTKIARQPTVSTRATAPEVVCTVSMYEWLFDHPDRVALAWQRLKVPAVPITDNGNGTFSWTDENGSEVVWRTVGTFADGLVWYASGKVKPGPATLHSVTSGWSASQSS